MRIVAPGLAPSAEIPSLDPDDPRLGMPEKALLEAVIDMATRLRWRHYHTHNSRRSEPGFPDLVLIRRRRIIYAELKATKGRITKAQDEWLTDLATANQNVHIWRPADWITGTIEEELRRP